MADSDDEYVQDLSDNEEVPQSRANTSGYGTRSAAQLRNRQSGGQPNRNRERWEDIQRSWDLVTEGADGSLAATVEGLLEAGKRKRLLQDTTPVQRGIIRHLLLILDLSSAMSEKDLKPSRHLLTLRYATDFVRDFFEQNPISQLGILGMRDGLAVRVSELSGNPTDHTTALANLRAQDPKGNPSLQNALEMARASLFHTPSHGTREAVIVLGALLSSDPGDIHKTILTVAADKIRVSVVGLAARMAICSELCAKTHGLASGAAADADPSIYGIALHEQHFRELLFAHITPPVMRAVDKASAPSLMTMGFPSRVEEEYPTLCACHAVPSRGGYLCSRCKAKVCRLPAQCPTCDLQLIQSTHLARSYRHLFRLSNWEEVSWKEARRKGSTSCFACLAPFPTIPPTATNGNETTAGVNPGQQQRQQKMAPPPAPRMLQKGVSESSRYRCTACDQHFCVDCDVYAHEILNGCGGCLSRPQGIAEGIGLDGDGGADDGRNGNGNGMAGGGDGTNGDDAMDVRE